MPGVAWNVRPRPHAGQGGRRLYGDQSGLRLSNNLAICSCVKTRQSEHDEHETESFPPLMTPLASRSATVEKAVGMMTDLTIEHHCSLSVLISSWTVRRIHSYLPGSFIGGRMIGRRQRKRAASRLTALGWSCVGVFVLLLGLVGLAVFKDIY